MKMAKRIFIALLIVALSVSSFVVFAAEEEPATLGYEKILEYFEEDSLIDFDFSDENVDYSAALNANRPSGRTNQFAETFVTDPAAPGGKYFSINVSERSGRTPYTDNHVYFGWTSAEAIDDFNIDMTVSGAKYDEKTTENDETLPKIIVVIGDNTFAPMSKANLAATGTTLMAVDFRGGFFTYLKNGQEHKTSFAIEENAWYNVSLTYDVDNGMSITIYNVADPEGAFTVTDGDIPLTAIKDIRIGAHGNDGSANRGTSLKFADISLQGGVYHRDVANMQADVEANIIEMYNKFNDESVSIEDKILFCEIVKQVKNYGFISENADVQKAIDELGVGAFGLYNAKIENFVSTVESLATYQEKKAYADETLVFVNALKEMDLSDATEEMAATTAKNLADFDAASKKLADTEAQSVKFVSIINSVLDHDLADYALVKADLALLEGTEPDLTYEGVAEAYKHYTKLVNAESDIRTSAQLFIEAVNVANDTSLDFNSRAVAYSSAEKNYFDNTTYPGVAEALVIFGEVSDYMQLEISNAENFIKYVNKADYALYISAKQENLDIAKTYMDICQPGFAGVAEAKLLYVEVENYIAEQRANAKAYIDAVNALDSLSGSALTNGIKTAESLQAAGNVLGVEGVTEANIKLNQLIASLELRERYCIHFINLVNSLDKANGAAETFAILADAKEAEGDADKSYAGVSDASAKLEKAIADFNAQVNAINAEFEKANNVAANTCGVGANVSTVSGHVIALVKKFFDEE